MPAALDKTSRVEDLPELCPRCRMILAELGRIGGRAKAAGMTKGQIDDHMKHVRAKRWPKR